MKTSRLISLIVLTCSIVHAQSVTFDFDNAPYRSSLPIDLTVAGLTAHFSADPAYYNFSVQAANALGFTPAGFSGLCIYPNTIYPCDLLISFNTALSDLSIMYSPEEYATDTSCTMRVTAFYNSRFVGTAVYTIPPDLAGTWPTGVLAITGAEPFNRVVIHYDKPPVTGGDWGPIFMADNLVVTIWSAPYARVDSIDKADNGPATVRGVSVPSSVVAIESTISLAQPFTFLTSVYTAADGSFQFDDLDAVLYGQRFYRATWP